jgi:hypothetical protein
METALCRPFRRRLDLRYAHSLGSCKEQRDDWKERFIADTKAGFLKPLIQSPKSRDVRYRQRINQRRSTHGPNRNVGVLTETVVNAPDGPVSEVHNLSRYIAALPLPECIERVPYDGLGFWIFRRPIFSSYLVPMALESAARKSLSTSSSTLDTIDAELY